MSVYYLWQIHCLIVLFSSHFHLDHCGALPYMSEMVGYDGPIYMTHPTKAICPILLEDFRKITVDKKGETNFFTSQMIKDCMKKVIPLNLHQTVQVQTLISFLWHDMHLLIISSSAPAVHLFWWQLTLFVLTLVAGGWWAWDQGILCRPCSGSCDGAHQSGIRVCGLYCECKQIWDASVSVH